MDEETIAKFWNRVKRGTPDECWEWQAGRTPHGYGKMRVQPFGITYSHRIAYLLTHGEIPNGLHICHTCDNPPCCNPAHLWAGTAADNMHDRDRKGRHRHGGGNRSNHPRKATPDIVEAIYQTYALGKLTIRQIAKQFNLSSGTIYRVLGQRIDQPHPNMRRKVDRETVERMRAARSKGARVADIARHFGLSVRHTRDILNGKYWKEVQS